MAEISKLSGVAIANVAKVDAVTKANIANINDLTIPSAAAFLLDTYTGAAAAYSVRKLKTGVTVAARIRRSGDDIEADVEFDTNNEISLTSPISNASSGTYTDLADFVDHTGTPRDAFIDEWKDQSGSGNHAAQATAANQPQLYDAATGLITENGKPAIQFSGSESLTRTDSVHSGTGAMSAQAVFTRSTTDKNGLYQLGAGSLAQFNWTNEWGYRVNGGNRLFSTSSPVAGTQVLASTYIASPASTSTMTLFIDGTSISATATNSQSIDIANNLTAIGGSYLGFGGGYFNGLTQELVFWSSDQTSNRTGIETDINDYYSIY